MKYTTIRVSEITKKQLDSLGKRGETHDTILARLLKQLKGGQNKK